MDAQEPKVGRIWRTFGLQPHRTQSFTLSPDPQLVEKLRDVVGLYVATRANGVVFSVDEKSQIQAPQRAQPILPMDLGQPERRTHNYVRHGSLDLFAALNVATGEVLAPCKPQHRAQDFVAFLREIEASVEPTLGIHVVLDNLFGAPCATGATVAAPSARAVSFTSTYASWLNLVERFFGLLTEKALKRGSHTSIPNCARHPGLRRRPQRPRYAVHIGHNGRGDPRQHAAIRSSRSVRCTANDSTILELTDPGDY